MTLTDRLLALLGAPIDSPLIANLLIEQKLTLETEPDLDEGVTPVSFISNQNAGYEVSIKNDKVAAIFLYLIPHDGFEVYVGPLPGDLSATSDRELVRRRFGQPEWCREAFTSRFLGHQGPLDRFAVGPLCIAFDYSEATDAIRRCIMMTAEAAP